MFPKEKVTIKDVARAAGVSTQTISRVINNRPDVSPDTRRRVLEIIKHMGYTPSALARSLIQQRSYTLGVVTAGLKFIGPSRTLNGITAKAQELGYSLLLKELPSFQANDYLPLLRSLLSRQVDGILWAVPEIGDNRAWVECSLPDLPVPIFFLASQPRPGIHSVAVDNLAGGRLAVEHLLALGRRQIGHISGPLDWWEARCRKQAWETTLTNAGLPVSTNAWVEGNWSSSSGEKAFQLLLSQYPEMDALFVANDQMALGVLKVACELGWDIPGRLAVVGFDDLAESAYFSPPLTTIRQDQYELGGVAVQELVNAITLNREGDGMVQTRAITLQPQLIVRQSSVGRTPPGG